MKPSTCRSRSQLSKPSRLVPTIILLLASSVECHAAAADDNNRANIAFVDAAAVTLTPDGLNNFTFDSPVKNSGKTGTAKASIEGADAGCAGAKIVDPDNKGITLGSNAIAIRNFKITGASLPATCYVRLTTDGTNDNTSLKQIKLTSQTVGCIALVLLAICLAITVLIIFFTGVRIVTKHKVSVTYRIGAPAWDFAKSWFSTTTLVGAIISGALALTGLPELTKYASKSGYSLLALLISLLVLVAPFIFIVFRRGWIKETTENSTKKYSVEYEGPLWAFLVSCAVTLFAGLAQLFVLWLLLHEVLQDQSWAIAGAISAVLLGLGLCVYSVLSIRLTVKLQKAEKDAKGKTDGVGEKIQLPSWSIL
jgi:hypothetical protein